MKHIIFDIISALVVLIPSVLILAFIILNTYLKKNTKRVIKNSIEDSTIKFLPYSPKLLKIWVRKDPDGNRALFSRFFFSYEKDDKPVHGQVLFRNKKLLDIKFYPEEYQDPNGRFPILSANDEILSQEKSSNIISFDPSASSKNE